MYTRILIATGGSPWSDAAAAHAIALAAQMGADLCVLTVLNVSGVYAMPDVMASSELLMESVEQQGQEMLAHTTDRAMHAGVPHVALLKWGNVAETILQTAAEEQCDLIVLGSRGLSGFKRLMLGSISNAVAAKAQCPVLVIKQPPLAPLRWRRVLVATGGSPGRMLRSITLSNSPVYSNLKCVCSMWISAGHAGWIASSVSPLMAKMFWHWPKRVRRQLVCPMRPSWRKGM